MFGLLVAALLGGASVARAQDTVRVRVGGDLTGRTGDTIEVPVVVDLTKAPGRKVASYDVTVMWDSMLLRGVNVLAPGFGAPVFVFHPNSVHLTGVLPAGAGGNAEIFRLQLRVQADTATSVIDATFADLSGPAPTFDNLMTVGVFQVQQGTFCRQRGRWGDTDNDGLANSRDALIALSAVVGLPTPGVDAGLADVDADGLVTSRDALIILSAAVGLPVPGFRVLLPAAGGCSAGPGITLSVSPGIATLVPGQTMRVLVTAQDSSGRPVPSSSLIWRTTNAQVAALSPDSIVIEARAAGTATVTAELGPGVMAGIAVTVIPRRTRWYVDIATMGVPGRTGDLASPVTFIGDAARLAQSGDTVFVGPGRYAEVVSTARALTIIGDSANRPVIDPRTAPSFSPDSIALVMGDAVRPSLIQHIDFVSGGARIRGAGVIARRLSFQNTRTRYAALEIDAGPALGAGTTPADGSNVLVEYVRMLGGMRDDGIWVRSGDTVVIRRDTLDGTREDNEGCGYDDDALIRVEESTRALIEDNDMGQANFNGVVAFATQRAIIRRNRLADFECGGLRGGAPRMEFEHNNVLSRGSDLSIVGDLNIDTLTSVGDSIENGMDLNGAKVSIVDSLYADTLHRPIQQYTPGTRVLVRHARVRVVGTSSFIQMRARNGVLETYRNVVDSLQSRGVDAGDFYDPMDTVLLNGDSVRFAGFAMYTVDATRYVQVDSARNDSSDYSAIVLSNVNRALVRGVRQRGAWDNPGFQAAQVDTLMIRDSRFAASLYGLFITAPMGSDWDSVRVINVVLDTIAGIALHFTHERLRLDSSVVRASGTAINLQDAQSALIRYTLVENSSGVGLSVLDTARAVIRNSRFSGNAIAITSMSTALAGSVIRQTNFTGNGYSVESFNNTADADSNYWNAPDGPLCAAGQALSCPGTGTTDSIAGSLTFADFLTAPASPTPVAPIGLSVRRAPGSSVGAARAVGARPPRPAVRAVSRPTDGAPQGSRRSTRTLRPRGELPLPAASQDRTRRQ